MTDDDREAHIRQSSRRSLDELLLLRLLNEARAEALKHKAKVSELAVTVGELRVEIEDWRGRLASQCGETLAARYQRDQASAEIEALCVPPDPDATKRAEQIVADAIREAKYDPADPHANQHLLDTITAGIARALTVASPEADVVERATQAYKVVLETMNQELPDPKAGELPFWSIINAYASALTEYGVQCARNAREAAFEEAESVVTNDLLFDGTAISRGRLRAAIRALPDTPPQSEGGKMTEIKMIRRAWNSGYRAAAHEARCFGDPAGADDRERRILERMP